MYSFAAELDFTNFLFHFLKNTLPIPKRFLLLSCLWWYAITAPRLSAQGLQNWSVESTVHIGRIIKHTPKIIFDVEGLTYAAELNLEYQTFGRKAWHQFQRFPQMGLSLIYHDLGDSKILGEALTAIPNINVVALQRQRLLLNFRFGIGLAWLTTPYNPLTNPTNNAIGSHWNGSVLFEFNSRIKLAPHWQLNGGISFIHYSNGGSHLPNFGLNIPALALGLQYTPKPVAKADYLQHELPKKPPAHRWGAIAWTTLAFRERGTPGGPSHPVYNVSAGVTYNLTKVNRLIGGIGYEYNKSAYEFGKHVYTFNSEKEAHWRSSRIQLFLADEFLFGRWGVTILMGAYASNDFYLIPFPIYNNLIGRYYLPLRGRLKCHIGVYLKSHIVVAEYLAAGVGLSF